MRLPSVLGWDGHHAIAVALDSADQLHVSGNMHSVPLIYFRSTRAFDVTSHERVTSMVGTNEQSVTYRVLHRPFGPELQKAAEARLCFCF